MEESESNGVQVTEAKPTMPEIQMVSWKDNSISLEWLKRMSLVKTSVFAIKPGINLINTMNVQISKAKPADKHCNIKSSSSNEILNSLGEQSVFGGLKASSESLNFNLQPLSANSSDGEDTIRRKPDSAYIGLINGIASTNALCAQRCTESDMCKSLWD